MTRVSQNQQFQTPQQALHHQNQQFQTPQQNLHHQNQEFQTGQQDLHQRIIVGQNKGGTILPQSESSSEILKNPHYQRFADLRADEYDTWIQKIAYDTWDNTNTELRKNLIRNGIYTPTQAMAFVREIVGGYADPVKVMMDALGQPTNVYVYDKHPSNFRIFWDPVTNSGSVIHIGDGDSLSYGAPPENIVPAPDHRNLKVLSENPVLTKPNLNQANILPSYFVLGKNRYPEWIQNTAGDVGKNPQILTYLKSQGISNSQQAMAFIAETVRPYFEGTKNFQLMTYLGKQYYVFKNNDIQIIWEGTHDSIASLHIINPNYSFFGTSQDTDLKPNLHGNLPSGYKFPSVTEYQQLAYTRPASSSQSSGYGSDTDSLSSIDSASNSPTTNKPKLPAQRYLDYKADHYQTHSWIQKIANNTWANQEYRANLIKHGIYTSTQAMAFITDIMRGKDKQKPQVIINENNTESLVYKQSKDGFHIVWDGNNGFVYIPPRPLSTVPSKGKSHLDGLGVLPKVTPLSSDKEIRAPQVYLDLSEDQFPLWIQKAAKEIQKSPKQLNYFKSCGIYTSTQTMAFLSEILQPYNDGKKPHKVLQNGHRIFLHESGVLMTWDGDQQSTPRIFIPSENPNLPTSDPVVPPPPINLPSPSDYKFPTSEPNNDSRPNSASSTSENVKPYTPIQGHTYPRWFTRAANQVAGTEAANYLRSLGIENIEEVKAFIADVVSKHERENRYYIKSNVPDRRVYVWFDPFSGLVVELDTTSKLSKIYLPSSSEWIMNLALTETTTPPIFEPGDPPVPPVIRNSQSPGKLTPLYPENNLDYPLSVENIARNAWKDNKHHFITQGIYTEIQARTLISDIMRQYHRAGRLFRDIHATSLILAFYDVDTGFLIRWDPSAQTGTASIPDHNTLRRMEFELIKDSDSISQQARANINSSLNRLPAVYRQRRAENLRPPRYTQVDNLTFPDYITKIVEHAWEKHSTHFYGHRIYTYAQAKAYIADVISTHFDKNGNSLTYSQSIETGATGLTFRDTATGFSIFVTSNDAGKLTGGSAYFQSDQDYGNLRVWAERNPLTIDTYKRKLKENMPNVANKRVPFQNGAKNGLCYVYAMLGAAADQDGVWGNYLATLNKIKSLRGGHSLYKTLVTLHYYFNKEHGFQPSDLKYTLENLIGELQKWSQDPTSTQQVFKLGGSEHAMAISVKKNPDDTIEYRLLDFDGTNDPEAIVIKANNLREFKAKLDTHFTSTRLDLYGIYDGKFEFKKVNTTPIKEIPIWIAEGENENKGYYLISGELITTKPEELDHLIARAKQNVDTVHKIIHAVQDDPTHYYLNIVPELEDVLTKLKQNNQITPNHIPYLDGVTQNPDKTYTIPFYNPKDDSVIYVKSSHSAFKSAQQYLKERAISIKNGYYKLRGKLDVNMPGVSSAFAAVYLMGLLANKEQDPNISEQLKTGLIIQYYIGFTQNAHGFIGDINSFKNFIKNPKFLTGFKWAGRGLSALSIGTTYYQLAQTKDPEERDILKIQLGMNIASTVMGIFSGPLSLILDGIGAILTYNLSSQLSTTREVRKLGIYLANVNKAYTDGFQYFEDLDVLAFPEDAVVSKMDLTQNRIEFGTHSLLTALPEAFEDDGQEQSALSLRAALHQHHTLPIHQQARDASLIYLPKALGTYIGWSKDVQYTRDSLSGEAPTLINPYLPNSKIGPGYDDGIVRRIEDYSREALTNGKVFTDETTIHRLESTSHRFIKSFHLNAKATNIEIMLPQEDKVLVIPNIEKNDWEKYNIDKQRYLELLKYHFIGNGGEYSIKLISGVSVHLSNQTPGTRWVLDARDIGDSNANDIKIRSGEITIGKTKIKLDTNQNLDTQQLSILTQSGILEIDLENNKVSRTVDTDARYWRPNYLPTLQDFFQRSTSYPLSKQKYIPIRHYQHSYSTRYRMYNIHTFDGNAYYDRERNRMLYTDYSYASEMLKAPEGREYRLKFLQRGELGAVIDDNVYFYSSNGTSIWDEKKVSYIWKVDANSGKIKDLYVIPSRTDTSEGKGQIRMWQENGKVYFSREGEHPKNAFTYLLDDEGIHLVSSQHTYHPPASSPSSIADTKDTQQNSEFSFTHYKIGNTAIRLADPDLITSSNEEFKTAPIVTISGKDKEGTSHRFWLYKGKQINVPSFFNKNPQTVENLKLVHATEDKNDQTIVFFFDPIHKALYRQVLQKNIHTHTDPVQIAVPIGNNHYNNKISNVSTDKENLFIFSEEGLIYHIDKDGRFSLEIITEDWLKRQRNEWYQGNEWYSKLISLIPADKKCFPIPGFKGRDQKPLSVWYDQGKFILAPNVSGENIQLLQTDENFAYLFDPGQGKIYRQPKINGDEFNMSFNHNHSLLLNHPISNAIELFPTAIFKTVWKENGILHAKTQTGAILNIENPSIPLLVRLDKSWIVRGDRDTAIRELITQWPPVAPFLPIESENDPDSDWHDTSMWYDTEEQRCVWALLPQNDEPQYIGLNRDQEGKRQTYYFQTNKGLKSFSFNINRERSQSHPALIGGHRSAPDLQEQKEWNSLSGFRIGDTIFLAGADSANFLSPILINNVNQIVLSPGKGNVTYDLTKKYREKIKHIIINNYGSQERSANKLHFSAKDYLNLRLTRKGNDLLIADLDGVVRIKNVFGLEKDQYHHLKIKFLNLNGSEYKTYKLSDLVQKMETEMPGLDSSSYTAFGLPDFEEFPILTLTR